MKKKFVSLNYALFLCFSLGACALPIKKESPSREVASKRSDVDYKHAPKHKFNLQNLAGNYRLVEENGSGGCFYISQGASGQDKIVLQYELRVIKKQDFWSSESYYSSINIKTEDRYLSNYLSDIDQGKLEYTRHDIENPSLLDYVGCVALYGSWQAPKIGVDYCKQNLNKKVPVLGFNPSMAIYLETFSTKENAIKKINQETREVNAGVFISKENIKELQLIDSSHIKFIQAEKKYDDEKKEILKECIYEKI